MSMLQPRRLLTDSHLFFALKIAVTMVGVLLPGWLLGMTHESVILSLGVVAGAIAEPDDSLSGRIKNLLMTLGCFLIATFSVQYLYPYPPAFALGLFTSTVGFIMLGALGPRYAAISFGSLLVAIYAMLGASQAPTPWYLPLWLCLGAMWYGLVSVIWLHFHPYKSLHEQLSQVYFALGRYFETKSGLFSQPVANFPQLRHQLSVVNIGSVTSLNQVKIMLQRRLGNRVPPHLSRLLQLYLLAQEIHEKITSSHYLYERLEQEMANAAILDGFAETLEQLGQACRQLGFAILMHRSFTLTRSPRWALQALADQLQLHRQQHQQQDPLHNSLSFLHQNLTSIGELLMEAGRISGQMDAPFTEPTPPQLPRESQPDLRGLPGHFTPDSPLFRHAIRMGVCLVSAYGLLLLFPIHQGFWVLLTCLFVCQSSYTATRTRLVERILGTLLGLVLGLGLLWLAPGPHGQLLIMGIAAVLFFAQLRSNYSAAVTFITLYAVTAFGLLGVEGSTILLPRLIDTLLGGLLSYLAVTFIWPDWSFRRLPALLAASLGSTAHYFTQVRHTLAGEHDALAYRIARRRAHQADCALAQAWQQILVEPKPGRRLLRLSVALTQRSHALISYVSTLGAHRQRLQLPPDNPWLQLGDEIERVLRCAAQGQQGELIHLPAPQDDSALTPAERLLAQEMGLIAEVANELLRLSWLMGHQKETP
ncbi:YccS family putative transporter [Pseudaeromonas paramecii]|uniref:YccS family putative transporter n=1 Tax=Pseudaeromonas paramecii TaxID=2138166 RepID=A0ABP8QHV3_9GAMM